MVLHKRFIKRLALLTASAVICTNALTVQAVDYTGHWAQEAISEWVSLGIIKGYEDGTVRPSQPITRAELAALISRVFNLNYTTNDISYDDVKEGMWYKEAVEEVASSKLMNDFGNEFRPNQVATREEAAYAIAHAYHISGGEGKAFVDSDQISEWAKDEVEALIASGHLQGRTDGTLAPKDSLTRADFVMMLDKITAKLYQNAGTYTENVTGNVVINGPDVTLKDMTITGNLYIAEGVGEGDVTLENVKIEGNVIVEGGGENSIEIINSKLNNVYVEKATGAVRVALDKESEIENIKVTSAIQLEGKIKNLEVATNQKVKLVDAIVENVKISMTGSKMDVDTKSTIEELVANGDAKITGKGTIKKAYINVDNVVFDGVKIDKNTIVVGENVNTPPVIENSQSGSGGSGGSSSSDRPEKPQVTGLGIIGDYQVTTGSSIKLIANVRATSEAPELKEVTWSIKEGSLSDVAINEEGIFTAGSTTGSAIVVATSKYDPSMRAEHRIEVITVDEYVPVESISLNHEFLELNAGQSLQLKVDVKPAYATNKGVLWETSDENVVKVDNYGIITAVGEGGAVVTATTLDGKHTVACHIQVKKQAVEAIVTGVQIEGPTTVEAGESITLRAKVTVTPDEEKYKEVMWYLKEAPYGATISRTGVLTVPDTTTGQAIVLATSKQDPTQYAEHVVTIIKKVPVERIELSEEHIEMLLGDQTSLTATVYPTDATNKEVVWTSSNPKVASVDDNGNITANGIGDSTITVSTPDGKVKASSTIKVNGYVLNGKVSVDSDSQYKEGVEVRLYSEKNNYVSPIAIAKTNSLGEYEFNTLAKGKYRVEATYGDDTTDYMAAQIPVAINEATHTMNLECKKITTLKITVVDSVSQKPVQYVNVLVEGTKDNKWTRKAGTTGGGSVKFILPESVENDIIYTISKDGHEELKLPGKIEQLKRNEITVQFKKEVPLHYPQQTTPASISVGANPDGVGDTTYGLLKEAGWRQEHPTDLNVGDLSTTKLSTNSRRLKFEYFLGNNIDAKVVYETWGGSAEEGDFIKVLEYMTPEGSDLTAQDLKQLIYNGATKIETKANGKKRTISIDYTTGVNPTYTITFYNYSN